MLSINTWLQGGKISFVLSLLFSLVFLISQNAWSDESQLSEETPLQVPIDETSGDNSQPSAESSEDEPGTEGAIELNRVTVTGSRIKRTDSEGALPVTVIDREAIELSGETSVPDLVRNLPFNSFGSYRSQFQGDQGSAQVDLRGLGSGRSLILIDGKRMSKSPTSTDSQNLNSIPLGSVDRIEILSDGASAVYGSDAIGGVINIITRRDYTGWELTYGIAKPKWGKGQREQGTAMFSSSGDDSRWLANLSWNNKDISFARDFPEFESGASIFGNNFDITDPDFGFPYFVWTAIPGGCEISDAFSLTPHEDSITGNRCVYDFARVFAQETSENTQGLLFKYERDLSDQWRTSFALNGSETDSWGRYAPLAFSSLFIDAPVPVDSPNNPTNPASHLYDPVFGPNVPIHWAHRFESLGFRDKYVDTSLVDADLSFNGWIGSTELDFGMRASRSDSHELFENLLNIPSIVQFIADGTYDLQNPGNTPQDALDAMTEDFESDWTFDQEEFYALVSWDWLRTDAGPVQWVIGGEYRKEHYYSTTTFDDPDQSADRSTSTLYFETLVPVSMDFEISLAGRYDDYSDWGNNFSPKVSFRWRINDELLTRASWGEGFRAPELYINSVDSFDYPGFRDDDPQSCIAAGLEPDCYFLYQGYETVSSALGAETSEQYSLGVVWEPAEWISSTLDYFDIEINNEIGFFGDGQILRLDQMGLSPPPGLGVERLPSGLITSITSGWGNWGLVETSGVDINTQVNFQLGEGRIRSNLQYAYLFEHISSTIEGDSIDIVGLPGSPQSRATLSNYYDIGSYTFSWNISYIEEQYESYIDEGSGELEEENVPSWVTHDMQANYRFQWDGRLSVGIQNVFERTPSDASSGDTYNYELYDYYGRVYYLNYTQTFD